MVSDITFTIGTDIIFLLLLFALCILGLIIYYNLRLKGAPLNARVDARTLIERTCYRVGLGTIAEAEKVEKEFLRTEIINYLDEVKRVINVILE